MRLLQITIPPAWLTYEATWMTPLGNPNRIGFWRYPSAKVARSQFALAVKGMKKAGKAGKFLVHTAAPNLLVISLKDSENTEAFMLKAPYWVHVNCWSPSQESARIACAEELAAAQAKKLP